MQDAWRAYLELALGLTEASRKRAQTVARRLVGQSGATAAQLQGLAEELLAAGVANREALTRIVKVEVDRTLAAVGLATVDELAAVTARVERLEHQLRAARAAEATGMVSATGAGSSAELTEMTPAGTPAVAKKAAKKAVAKKAVAKKAAKKAVAKKAAKKAVAKKAVAKKITPPAGAGSGPA